MGGSNSRRERLLGVVGRFYEAATDETAWRGAAAELAAIFDAPSAALHVRSRSEDVRLLDFTENLRITGERHREEAAHWRTNDLWVKRAREIGPGRVILGQDLFEAAAFERTAFYQDWCRKQEQFHLVAALIQMEDGTAATFGIHRPRTASAFGEPHRRLGRVVFEHFRRALLLRARLQAAAIDRFASAQAAHRSQIAVVAVDEQRGILHANPLARQVLVRGEALDISSGHLLAHSRVASDALARLVARAAACARAGRLQLAPGAGEASLAVARGGRLPLTITVAPLTPADLAVPVPGALVFIRDPELPSVRTRALRELFLLTPAEAAVAALLAAGKSLEDAAHELAITIHTARSHVKQLLAKTGTNRQGEAIALILKSIAVAPD